MKFLTTLIPGIIIYLSASNGWATEHHLEQAIQHTEAAISSINGAVIAEQAEMARIHATSAKKNSRSEADSGHLDEGIRLLETAVHEGKLFNSEAAKKAAMGALEHLTQSEK